MSRAHEAQEPSQFSSTKLVVDWTAQVFPVESALTLGHVTEAHTLPDELKSRIPAINTFSVSAHVNGGFSGAIRVDARDETAAAQLRDVVRGALAAGQLIAADDPRVNTMLKSMQITGSGNTVGLTFTMPAGLLDVMKGFATAHGMPHAPESAPHAPHSAPQQIHK